MFSSQPEADLMMISTFLLPCVLFGTLKAVTGLTIYDTSNYKRINDVVKCADLGDDWDLALIDNGDEEYEFELLNEALRPSCQCYQIGGSTNDTRQWRTELDKYYHDNSGVSKVKVLIGCGGNEYYLLRDDSPWARSNQFLCEKRNSTINGFLEFSSLERDYKILVDDSANHNFTYWSSECEALGDGWDPAVLDSQEELNFIRVGQKRNRALGSYWIGGSTAAEIDSTIKYPDYYTNASGPYNVIINPGKSFRRLKFRLKAKASSRKTQGILCENAIVKPIITEIELASTTSKYRKLVGRFTAKINYTTGALYCSNIGNGWKPAVLDTQEEYDFIREGQKSFNSSVPYWIGGSTNVTSNKDVHYNDYIGNNSGQNGVYVETKYLEWNYILGWTIWAVIYDKYTFKLSAQSHPYGAPGILCEQAINTTGLEFASAESYYKKIVGSANNYSHYASKCKELGTGWKPALLETRVEYDFIRQGQKGLKDDKDYFIGGSAHPANLLWTRSLRYHIGPYAVRTPLYSIHQSEYPVYVTTYDSKLMQNSNNNFGLMSGRPHITTTGILCEKAVV